MDTSFPRGRPADNPADPINRFVSFAASRADIERANRLARLMGKTSRSALIRSLIAAEYARVAGAAEAQATC